MPWTPAIAPLGCLGLFARAAAIPLVVLFEFLVSGTLSLIGAGPGCGLRLLHHGHRRLRNPRHGRPLGSLAERGIGIVRDHQAHPGFPYGRQPRLRGGSPKGSMRLLPPRPEAVCPPLLPQLYPDLGFLHLRCRKTHNRRFHIVQGIVPPQNIMILYGGSER
jgi:hypothetical protein